MDTSIIPTGGHQILAIFAKGGPAMYALLLCSFLGTYIVIQKLLFLRFNRIESGYVATIKTMLTKNGRSATATHLKNDGQIVSRVVANALNLAKLGREEIQQGIKETTYLELPKIEGNIRLLSGIVTAAPMLGLLGTVLGLIHVFKVVSGGALGDTAAISGGISEAMITTVTGLAIAIPFIFLTHYVQSKLDAYMMDIERCVHEVVNFYKLSENDIKA